jgi:hypothetical protein
MMTEQDWVTTYNSSAMFDCLWTQIGFRQLNHRKLMLFALACYRATPLSALPESVIQERDRRSEVAERFADRLATAEEVRQLWPLRYHKDPSTGTTWPENPLDWAGSYRACEVHPSISEKAIFFRCIFGNPFRTIAVEQSWLTSTVVALADGIYQERAFDRMPILADALQDAGCDKEDILNHCRQPGEHVRGCWVVDLLLGKS